MSLRLMQAVLILAPLLLGASIAAYWRLRRYVCDGDEPIVIFLQRRWNTLLIVVGGFVLFRGAAISDGVGTIPQLFGFLLSLLWPIKKIEIAPCGDRTHDVQISTLSRQRRTLKSLALYRLS